MPRATGNLKRKVLEQFVRIQAEAKPVVVEKKVVIPAPLPEPVVKEFRSWATADSRKSKLMRALESHFDEPMEEILSMDRPGVVVAVHLGVSESTVTRWRERLGLVQPYPRRKRS